MENTSKEEFSKFFETEKLQSNLAEINDRIQLQLNEEECEKIAKVLINSENESSAR